MITDESIENVKARIEIVDVISSYLELKKSGSNFKARCPFHEEKSASFVISPAKQIYHCFGCSAGGDAIKFIMEYEKLNYAETIEKLANDYNVQLDYTKSNKPVLQINYSLLEMANEHFKKNLHHQKEARDYLLQRSVFESSIEKFQIGYARESEEFMRFLRQNNVDPSEANRVGLVGRGDNGGDYAIFRQRIIFPIHSPKNKIVGFGGRTSVEHNAKYLNSPQSSVFNKSRLLYGYNLARANIISSDEVIIAEGYLDVVLLHQAGFANAVATLGTAMTKEHIPIISKLTKNIILSFDGDRAGREAGYKALLLLQESELSAKIAIFEQGVDPADMVARGNIEALQAIFRHAKNAIEYILEFIAQKYDLSIPTQKQEAFNECMVFYKKLDSIMQFEYRSFLSNLLSIDDNMVPTNKQRNQPVQLTSEDLAELCVLKTMLNSEKLLEETLEYIEPEMFMHHKNVFLDILSKAPSSLIREIELREDLSVLNDETFFLQIAFLMQRFYQSLRKRKLKASLGIQEKSYIMRKLQENIKALEKGQLAFFDKDLRDYFEF